MVSLNFEMSAEARRCGNLEAEDAVVIGFRYEGVPKSEDEYTTSCSALYSNVPAGRDNGMGRVGCSIDELTPWRAALFILDSIVERGRSRSRVKKRYSWTNAERLLDS